MGRVSIEKLRHSLLLVIEKHSPLRTALKYDQNEECLMQTIKPMTFGHDLYKFQISKIRSREELENILFDEETNETYFDLANGIVFRCHIIRMMSEIDDDDDLAASSARMNDYILFNFHHVAFDGYSTELFQDELHLAYSNDTLDFERSLQYIDYAQHEKQLDMTKAEEFWKHLLDGFEIDKHLELPYDRRPSTTQRSGYGSSVNFEFDRELVENILAYADEVHVSVFQLALTCYYIFLLNLSNGENDLCFGNIHANRYRPELHSIIGMFVNLLPYRMKLDPTWSFEHTLLQVQNLCLQVLENSHLPYQKIVQLNHHQSKIVNHLPFMPTVFRFDSINTSNEQIQLDDATIYPLSLYHTNHHTDQQNVSKFDLLFSVEYHHINKIMKCSIDYSTDLFDQKTIKTMCDRFCVMLQQLFGSSSLNSATLKQTPICELSILLPYEINLL
ncbi:unnamed protein product, partial [Didymodactylos carnosus]